MKHNLIVRFYGNQSASIHVRKDTGDCKVSVHENWAFASSNVKSTVYENIRAGLLNRVELVASNISEAQGKALVPGVEAMLEHQGYKVIQPGK